MSSWTTFYAQGGDCGRGAAPGTGCTQSARPYRHHPSTAGRWAGAPERAQPQLVKFFDYYLGRVGHGIPFIAARSQSEIRLLSRPRRHFFAVPVAVRISAIISAASGFINFNYNSLIIKLITMSTTPQYAWPCAKMRSGRRFAPGRLLRPGCRTWHWPCAVGQAPGTPPEHSWQVGGRSRASTERMLRKKGQTVN